MGLESKDTPMRHTRFECRKVLWGERTHDCSPRLRGNVSKETPAQLMQCNLHMHESHVVWTIRGLQCNGIVFLLLRTTLQLDTHVMIEASVRKRWLAFSSLRSLSILIATFDPWYSPNHTSAVNRSQNGRISLETESFPWQWNSAGHTVAAN